MKSVHDWTEKISLQKNHNKNFLLIWGVGLLAAWSIALLLRLPYFGTLPSGLNRDEAALGYNAYSILKTGKDEWGKSWPISITSFGDQKLPGYIYMLVPFIAMFGLEIWVIRLPSLLSGLVVILSMGVIATKLAHSAGLSQKTQLLLSWLVMLLLSISPWQLHFSRVAYEAHLAMAFLTSGFASALVALDSRSKKTQRVLLITAGLLLSATLLTYHSYQVFTPLFILSLVLIYRKKLFKLDRVGLSIAISTGVLAVCLLLAGGIVQANQSKSIGINPFAKQTLLEEATVYRAASGFPPIVNKLLFNWVTEGVTTFSQNYLSTISGTFFFIHGSNHGDHNPGNGNNVHIFIAPFILIGLLVCWTNRKYAAAKVILVWLFLSLVPSSLTNNPSLEVRISIIFPILELLATIGICYTLQFFNKKGRIVFSAAVLLVAVVSALRFFIFYTVLSKQLAVDNSPYHLLAQTLYKYQQQGRTVFTHSASSSPYIWYLFENKVDPAHAQQAVVHYEPSGSFRHVRQIDNITFLDKDWTELSKSPGADSFIVIGKPKEISQLQLSNTQYKQLEIIRDAAGAEIYEVWEYR